jgi:hypothetical protein
MEEISKVFKEKIACVRCDKIISEDYHSDRLNPSSELYQHDCPQFSKWMKDEASVDLR